ncbi:beta-amyrin 11-oxidase [Trifolium repens]|nr:beta-amyrin 11-oxidase [Trifolium repens]
MIELELSFNIPPGHLGWPLIGNMLAFIKDFKSGHPDSFINNLISRYGRTGMYKSHLFGSPSIIVCDADMCRKVLTDDETFKIGYPKSTLEMIKCKFFWSSSREEQKRFKRLLSVLSSYYGPKYIRNVPNSHGGHPSSLKFSWASSYNQHIVTKIENSFTEMYSAMFSMPINFPGFAFHKGLLAREKLAKLIQPIVEERRLMKKKRVIKKIYLIFFWS